MSLHLFYLYLILSVQVLSNLPLTGKGANYTGFVWGGQGRKLHLSISSLTCLSFQLLAVIALLNNWKVSDDVA